MDEGKHKYWSAAFAAIGIVISLAYAVPKIMKTEANIEIEAREKMNSIHLLSREDPYRAYGGDDLDGNGTISLEEHLEHLFRDEVYIPPLERLSIASE